MSIVVKYVALFFIALCGCFSGVSQPENSDERIVLSITTGLKSDNLTWSIAGNLNGANPNIFSELIWKNISASQTKIEGYYKISKRFIFLAELTRGFVFSGSVTDSDYDQDNRTARTFFAQLESNKGMSYSVTPTLGFTINPEHRIKLTPSVGYGWSGQKFYLHDDTGLKSTYQTFWKGLMGSLHARAQHKKFLTEINVNYHQVNYDARANWNLVDNFQHPISFEHTAKGFGIETSFVLGYQISQPLALLLQTEFWKWSTGLGIDQLYLNDGSVEKTRLNDVTRDGYAVRAGINYRLLTRKQ